MEVVIYEEGQKHEVEPFVIKQDISKSLLTSIAKSVFVDCYHQFKITQCYPAIPTVC